MVVRLFLETYWSSITKCRWGWFSPNCWSTRSGMWGWWQAADIRHGKLYKSKASKTGAWLVDEGRQLRWTERSIRSVPLIYYVAQISYSHSIWNRPLIGGRSSSCSKWWWSYLTEGLHLLAWIRRWAITSLFDVPSKKKEGGLVSRSFAGSLLAFLCPVTSFTGVVLCWKGLPWIKIYALWSTRWWCYHNREICSLRIRSVSWWVGGDDFLSFRLSSRFARATFSRATSFFLYPILCSLLSHFFIYDLSGIKERHQ